MLLNPLVAIRLVHTAVWVFMVGCILALPIVAIRGRFDWAVRLTAVVLAECSVLALNGGRCPLTDIAGRFTNDRVPNFDIYLPEWVAAQNKTIFGTLFVVMEVFVLWRWMQYRRGFKEPSSRN